MFLSLTDSTACYGVSCLMSAISLCTISDCQAVLCSTTLALAVMQHCLAFRPPFLEAFQSPSRLGCFLSTCSRENSILHAEEETSECVIQRWSPLRLIVKDKSTTHHALSRLSRCWNSAQHQLGMIIRSPRHPAVGSARWMILAGNIPAQPSAAAAHPLRHPLHHPPPSRPPGRCPQDLPQRALRRLHQGDHSPRLVSVLMTHLKSFLFLCTAAVAILLC